METKELNVNPGTITQGEPPAIENADVVQPAPATPIPGPGSSDLTMMAWAIQECERLMGQGPLKGARAAYNRIHSRMVATPGAPMAISPAGASVDQLEREFLQQVAPVANLNDWSSFVNAWADSKGWNDKPITGEDGQVRNEFLGEQLMLIVTELAEAQEDNRKGLLQTYREEGTGKPCGLPSELADTMIRIFHLCARLGINLNFEVSIKMAYNYSRAKRHGGLRS